MTSQWNRVHPQQVADDTKLCGSVNTLEGMDAIPDRQKKEACANNGVQHEAQQGHVVDLQQGSASALGKSQAYISLQDT